MRVEQSSNRMPSARTVAHQPRSTSRARRAQAASPRVRQAQAASPRVRRAQAASLRGSRAQAASPRGSAVPRAAPLAPIQRIRWDRVGRLCLLLVLVAVVALYVEHTISFFATRAEAQRVEAYVRELRQANARLEAEQRALRQPATIAARARGLGMVRAGEQPYVVSGLPGG